MDIDTLKEKDIAIWLNQSKDKIAKSVFSKLSKKFYSHTVINLGDLFIKEKITVENYVEIENHLFDISIYIDKTISSFIKDYFFQEKEKNNPNTMILTKAVEVLFLQHKEISILAYLYLVAPDNFIKLKRMIIKIYKKLICSITMLIKNSVINSNYDITAKVYVGMLVAGIINSTNDNELVKSCKHANKLLLSIS